MGESDAKVCVGLDIGRHRLFAVSSEPGGGNLLPLAEDHPGLLLRWLADDGPRRFSDRVRAFAGVDDRAIGAATDVAAAVAPKLMAADHIRVAVPASFGPQCRVDVVQGMQAEGLNLDVDDLIDRPVAAAAGWLAHRRAVSASALSEPVLVIDNDGGELSALVLDPPTKRLLTLAPLSTSGSDDPADVATRLHDLIEVAARLTHPADEMVRDDSLSASAARIAHVVITGTGATAAPLVQLVAETLPNATLEPDAVTPAEHCVVTGLNHLDELASWIACWPTLDLVCDSSAVIHRGPQAINALGEEHLVPGTTNLQLRGRGGHTVPLAAGSIRGSGVAVPLALSEHLRIKVLDDGRVLFLGPSGTVPLALCFGWPSPGTTAESVAIRSIGRRAVSVAEERAPERPRLSAAARS